MFAVALKAQDDAEALNDVSQMEHAARARSASSLSYGSKQAKSIRCPAICSMASPAKCSIGWKTIAGPTQRQSGKGKWLSNWRV